MNRNVLEDFYNDPARYRRLAQREQARAIREGFAWLSGRLARQFADLKAHLTRRVHAVPARWIERLG